jgi:hypothetical protein
VFHNDVKTVRCLDDLVHLNYVWVAHNLQYMDLTGYSFDVIYFCDFIFLQNFDCDFLPSEQMNALLNFAESALTQRFGNSVATDDLLTQNFRVFINFYGWQVR